MATVFVADDNPHVHTIVKETLSVAGHQVLGTMATAGVIDKVVEARPHLLFLDSSSSAEDSYEQCSRVTGRPELENLSVVLLAGPLSVVDEHAAVSAGAVAVLRKPLDPEELTDRIESWIEAESVEPEGRELSEISLDDLVSRALTTDEPVRIREVIREQVEAVLVAAIPAIVDRITDRVVTELESG
ncbi:MAG: response regulator [Bryobacterales bacterium]|nr:response regulator [Bryobacterales bacterium]